jgi:uncharacterized protein (TIGR02246 family)
LAPTDRLAIQDLVTEMVWRVDHGEAHRVWELFTPEGVMAIGRRQIEGHEELKAWGAERDQDARWTRHVCTAPRIEVVDPDHVRATALGTVYAHTGEGRGSTVPMSVNEYRDVFVRRDGHWRFQERRLSVLFVAPDPGAG